MRLTDAIYSRLTADATVAALVGTRVYPLVMPQPPTFPAVVYTRLPQTEGFTADGPNGFISVRVQIDCYAVATAGVAGYDSARTLADAVRTALNGWKSAALGVQSCRQIESTEQDLLEPKVGSEDEGESYRVTMDFLVEGSED